MKKIKLAFFNLALIIYLVGLLCAIGVAIGFGAVMVIIASLIVLCIYSLQLYGSIKDGKLFSREVLLYSLSVLIDRTYMRLATGYKCAFR